MTIKKLKRVMALAMAFVLTVGAVIPTAAYANATGPDAGVTADGSSGSGSGGVQAEEVQEPVLYNETDRPDLEPAEIATAEDIIVAAGYGFDVEQSFDGISYDEKAVSVSYYAGQGSFDGNQAGDYSTYYKVEPISGKLPYLICRTVSVREPEMAVEESRESGDGQQGKEDGDSGEEEPAPGEGSVSPSDAKPALLSEGEMETFSAGDTMMIRMASAPVLKAAEKSSGKDSMKVSCSGYAKYCGHSMGIKYISESGDYHNHLVYCLNLNKNTTNGKVDASASKSSIKPEITFCMVNGARTLNGKCHNSKYSAGSASADYFITGAAVHVLNGEVKLSYYNNGSGVYKKIAALVSDAKNYDEDEYDAATGTTKSITYTISPKRTEWQDMGDGLYRSKEKFVRTKTGSITNVSYKITGQPGGLTVGELKTDASEIEDGSDLKKYDICVAQTDADKPSSNFYLYCNGEAMKKILAAESTVKLTATAKSKEKGGRKWTPTVVSQQKITFLEEFEPGTVTASVKVTSKFKEGKFELHKTNIYNGRPVPGATYYLYEDAECTDLLCKLEKTNDEGQALSNVFHGKDYGYDVRFCLGEQDLKDFLHGHAEVKALATGNPYIKQKMDLDIQVSKLKLMKANHTSQKYRLEDNIAKHYPQQIAILKERISGMTADIQTAKANLPADKEQFFMKVGDKAYTDKKEAGAALVEMCKEMKTVNVPATVGEYAGFKMAVSFDSFNHKFVMNLKGQLSHNLEIGSDPLGNIARINHALESMPKQLSEAQTKLETVERQLETAKVEVEKPFAQEAELAEKLERLSALNALLNMDEKGDDALGMDDVPEEENEGQETSGHNVQKSGQEENPETGENVADAQAPYPVENAGHNYAVDNGSPQGLKLTAGMADKPVQRASLREKLEAFKAKAVGTEKQENRKEKGKEVTM